jgi:hypothetical protein
MNKRSSSGRPSTKPARLKNGFYVGIKNKGMSNQVMMYSPNKEGMLLIAERYSIFREKEVVILGEHKDDSWVSERKPVKKKAAAAH